MPSSDGTGLVSRRPIVRLILRPVFYALLALPLLWQIGSRQTARWLLHSGSPDAAALAAPQMGAPKASLAIINLLHGHVDRANGLATDALRVSVFSPLALRSLLVASELSTNRAAERQLAAAASSLGWHDQPTQLALLVKSLQANNMRDAAARVDAIARTASNPTSIFPLIDDLIERPGFRDAIVVRLAAKPGWRLAYLTGISTLNSRKVQLREAVTLAAAAGDKARARRELSAYVWWHVARFDIRAAYSIWRNRIADEALIGNGTVYDAQFRKIGDASSALPFEWSQQDLADASAGSVTKHGNLGLEVRTDGTVDGKIIEQMTILPVGAYMLSILYQPGDGAVDEAFHWAMTCGAGRMPLALQPIARTSGRTNGQIRLTYSLSVPPAKCPFQHLSLHLDRTDVPTETTAIFNAVTIGPLGAS